MLILKTPVAWYCRKSDNKSDLQRQRDLLIAWCLKHGVHIPEALRFEDTGSRDKSKKRPQFQKMMEAVRRGEIGTVIIQSFERFGVSDSDEFFKFRGIFLDAKAVLLSIDESEGNLTDKDHMTLLKVIFKAEASRDEQKKKGERAISGKHTRLLSAKSFQGGPCPYGYDKQTYTQQGQLLWTVHYHTTNSGVQILPDGGRVEFQGKNQHPVKARYDRVVLAPSLDKKRIEAIRLIFKLWTEQNISINRIAAHLNQNGHSIYDRPWSVSSVRNILNNEVYIGALVFNKCRVGRFAEVVKGEQRTISEEERGKRKLRTPDEWLVVPDVHEPLVDAATFKKSREKLGSIGYRQRPPRLVACWLKSLVYCGHCGRGMVGRKIGKHHYLVCDTRKKEVTIGLTPTCDFNGIRHDRLEEMLSGEFAGVIDHGKDRANLEAYMKRIDCALVQFLARSALQESMFAEMLQRVADKLKLGVKVTHSYSEFKKLVLAAGVTKERLSKVQASVLLAWDAEIEAELVSINEQLEVLSEKWLTASGILAEKLAMKVKGLEDRKSELEARKSGNIMRAYQAGIEDFVAFIDRCKKFQKSDDVLAKSESLRQVVRRIVLTFQPKTVKGKSRLANYRLEYCGPFGDHATA